MSSSDEQGEDRVWTWVMVDRMTGQRQRLGSADHVSTPHINLRGEAAGGSFYVSDYVSDYVFGDRFVFPVADGEHLRLMSVRHGQDPRLFWTYPSELVATDDAFPLRATLRSSAAAGIRDDRIAWVRSSFDGEVTADTRSTLFVTDASNGRTEVRRAVRGRRRPRTLSGVACQEEDPEDRGAMTEGDWRLRVGPRNLASGRNPRPLPYPTSTLRTTRQASGTSPSTSTVRCTM